jgi:hypothetical protein
MNEQDLKKLSLGVSPLSKEIYLGEIEGNTFKGDKINFKRDVYKAVVEEHLADKQRYGTLKSNSDDVVYEIIVMEEPKEDATIENDFLRKLEFKVRTFLHNLQISDMYKKQLDLEKAIIMKNVLTEVENNIQEEEFLDSLKDVDVDDFLDNIIENWNPFENDRIYENLRYEMKDYLEK